MRRATLNENVLSRSLIEGLGSPFLLLRELTKRLTQVLPETLNQYAFNRFCGGTALSKNAHFVMGNFEDVRVRDGLKLIEAFPRAREEHNEIIYGSFSPNAVAMLTALFVRHTGTLLQIAPHNGGEDRCDGTSICYGSSDWNLKTFDVETSPTPLCKFVFDETGRRAFEMGEQRYMMEERDGAIYDKAILQRLNIPDRSGHCLIVCAGISEWGSLAAVHYLTKNWKLLHERFDDFWRRKDFCILLEVQCGQFEKTTELASNVRLGRSF